MFLRLKNKCSQSWHKLSSSEQRTIQIGSIILLPAMAYFLLWLPANTAVDRLNAKLPRARAAIIDMQQQAQEFAKLKAQTPSAQLDENSLAAIVKDVLGTHGVTTATQIVGPRAIKLTGDHVNFSDIMLALQDLQKNHHVRVSSLSAEKSVDAGYVKLDCTLVSGAD